MDSSELLSNISIPWINFPITFSLLCQHDKNIDSVARHCNICKADRSTMVQWHFVNASHTSIRDFILRKSYCFPEAARKINLYSGNRNWFFVRDYFLWRACLISLNTRDYLSKKLCVTKKRYLQSEYILFEISQWKQRPLIHVNN